MLTWPKHLGGTEQQWRRKKRKELDTILALMDDASLGCLFLPGNGQTFIAALELLRQQRAAMRTREWKKPAAQEEVETR